MTRRTPLRPAALLAAFVLALVALTLASPRAQAADPAAESYGGCLVGQKKGDLLVLVDESGSLNTNDPENARVAAGRYLLGQFANFAAEAGVDLDVSLAGFSTDYHEVLGWTPLDEQSKASVLNGMDRFAERNDGNQTDYWNGLNGARTRLTAKAKGDPGRCQAVVWLTDGGFNISLTKTSDYQRATDGRTKRYDPTADLRQEADVQRASAAALRDLCRSGGLADQLRQQQVTLFAVGLSGPGAGGTDFDTMENVATGKASCGSRTEPVPGSFIKVSDIDSLIVAFDGLVPGRSKTIRPTPVCRTTPADCRSTGHVFVLDDAVNQVHILATAQQPGRQVFLLPPSGQGEPIELVNTGTNQTKPLDSRIIGGTSTYEWLSDWTVVADLGNRDYRATPWTGAWSLVFFDPEAPAGETASSTISLNSELQPTWPGQRQTELRSGGPVDGGITFGLANRSGEARLTSAVPGTLGLAAQLIPVTGKPIDLGPLDKSTLTTPQQVDLTGVTPGPATLRMTLTITTKAAGGVAGTPLEPKVAELAVDILPAFGLPVPAAAGVDFGHITGPADADGTLALTGPGCVWLPPNAPIGDPVGPEGLGAVTITSTATSADGCLLLAEGQQATLALRLTTAEAGNGTLAGTIPVSVSPVDAKDRVTVLPVRFTADLEKPLRTGVFIAGLIAALVLGPGIPLLILAGWKRWAARIPGQTLVAQDIPVTVVEGQVLRDGAPLALRDSDFRSMVRLRSKGSRQAAIPGGVLRTRTGWSPFGAGFVVAETPGRVGLSSTHPEPYGSERAARLPLAVHNTWLVSRDPAAPAGQATVILLAGLDPTGQRRTELVEDAVRRLPGLMTELGSGPTDAGRSVPPSPAPASAAPPPPPPSFSYDFSDDGDDVGPRTS